MQVLVFFCCIRYHKVTYVKLRRLALEKVRIAIVEDDPTWLDLMTDFLNRENDFTVVGTALNKEEAIQMVKSTSGIDIILMDINLSENKYDGISTALEIFETWNVKIIMLTSLSGDDLITKSLMIIKFVQKAFTPEHMFDIVK